MKRLVVVAFVCACSTDESGNPTGQSGGADAGTAGRGAGGASVSTGGANAGAAGGSTGGRSAGGSAGSGSGGASGTATGGAAGSAGASGGASGAGGSGGTAGTGGANGTGGAPTTITTGFVYVGSGNYSGPNGAVTLYRFDYATQALSQVERVPVGGLASFLAIDGPRNALYAADEADGNLRRLALDPTTHVPSSSAPSTSPTGGHPVHVSTTSDGKFVLVAHYNEGKAESFGVQNGSLGASLDVESPGSQAHAIVLSLDERFAFVPCKGSNRIVRYSFDAATGALTAVTPSVTTQSGDGPRHMAFHPSGRFAYVINENSSSVIAYSYNVTDGALSELMRTTSLPQGFSGTSTGSEIAVDPSGRFLYASNRYSSANGDIVAFGIAPDGRISLVGHQSTGGRTPRSFSIDPTGHFLFVGNQSSNTVAVLAIDPATGSLGAPKTTDVGVSPYYVGPGPFTE